MIPFFRAIRANILSFTDLNRFVVFNWFEVCLQQSLQYNKTCSTLVLWLLEALLLLVKFSQAVSFVLFQIAFLFGRVMTIRTSKRPFCSVMNRYVAPTMPSALLYVMTKRTSKFFFTKSYGFILEQTYELGFRELKIQDIELSSFNFIIFL